MRAEPREHRHAPVGVGQRKIAPLARGHAHGPTKCLVPGVAGERRVGVQKEQPARVLAGPDQLATPLQADGRPAVVRSRRERDFEGDLTFQPFDDA